MKRMIGLIALLSSTAVFSNTGIEFLRVTNSGIPFFRGQQAVADGSCALTTPLLKEVTFPYLGSSKANAPTSRRCQVLVDEKVFEQSFRMCALSEFNSTAADPHCGFGVVDQKGKRFYEFIAEGKGYVQCTFVCTK